MWSYIINLVKSKTIWFSLVLALLSVLQGFIFQFNLEPSQEMLLGASIAGAIAFLRALTTTSLSDK